MLNFLSLLISIYYFQSIIFIPIYLCIESSLILVYKTLDFFSFSIAFLLLNMNCNFFFYSKLIVWNSKLLNTVRERKLMFWSIFYCSTFRHCTFFTLLFTLERRKNFCVPCDAHLVTLSPARMNLKGRVLGHERLFLVFLRWESQAYYYHYKFLLISGW